MEPSLFPAQYSVSSEEKIFRCNLAAEGYLEKMRKKVKVFRALVFIVQEAALNGGPGPTYSASTGFLRLIDKSLRTMLMQQIRQKKKQIGGSDDFAEAGLTDAYDRLPAYYRLQKNIEQEIISGDRQPGERIPSEKEYALRYGISIGTVRKALEMLVQKGFLERIRGKGSFVRSRAMQNETLRYYRYVQDFHSIHKSLQICSLGMSRVKAPDICSILNIEPESSLIYLRRIFKSGKEPLVFSISYFPDALFPNMHKLPSDIFDKQTIYTTVEKQFGITTKDAKEFFQADSASSEVARHLRLAAGSPVLCIHMLAVSYQDIAYEYRQSYCNTQSLFLLRDKGLF